MKLTQENYYGREASMKYMSVSQFKSFLQCEAAALAECKGEYVRPMTTALLVGSYVDARLEGDEAFEAFKAEHPEIFKKDGTPKADFVQAEEIYQRIKSDRLMSLLLSGKHQVIVTGKIARVPWRGKIDSLCDEDLCKVIMAEFPDTAEALGGPFCTGAIVDGKVMRDFAPVWSDAEGRKLHWIDAWGYHLQGAAYKELIRQMTGKTMPFVLAPATKETVTDLDALYVPYQELEAGLRLIEEKAPIFQAIKQGKREPVACGKCDYCKSQKKLTTIKNYKEI